MNERFSEKHTQKKIKRIRIEKMFAYIKIDWNKNVCECEYYRKTISESK